MEIHSRKIRFLECEREPFLDSHEIESYMAMFLLILANFSGT